MDPAEAQWTFQPMPGNQVRITLARQGRLGHPGEFVTEVVLDNSTPSAIFETLVSLSDMYRDLPEPETDSGVVL